MGFRDLEEKNEGLGVDSGLWFFLTRCIGGFILMNRGFFPISIYSPAKEKRVDEE